jgi:hypothetical protein
MSPRNIVVIGGGVAGLSAAHHLSSCGHHVTVLEKRTRANTDLELGGKAFSFRTEDGLAAEHGFRFYPGFYRHVVATMGEIPTGPGTTVADRLVGLTQAQIAADNDPKGLKGRITLPVPSTRPHDGFSPGFPTLDVGSIEIGRVLALLWRMFTMPFPAKVTDQNPKKNGKAPVRKFDDVDWWRFSGSEAGSEAFRAFFGIGLSRCFVATRAERMSARTGAEILMTLLFDFSGMGESADADRAFDRPTSEAWFDDWKIELLRRGVKFQNAEVQKLEFSSWRKRVTGIKTASSTLDEFDDVVLAVALDDARKILRRSLDLVEADPELDRLLNGSKPTRELAATDSLSIGGCVSAVESALSSNDAVLLSDSLTESSYNALQTLTADSMSGIVFYPSKPLANMIEGHYLVVESQWALTAVYQSPRWWPMATDTGQLSVIISDWHSHGSLLAPIEHGVGSAGAVEKEPRTPPAKTCEDDMLADEVWRQLQAAIPELVGEPRPARFVIDPAQTTFVNGIRNNTMPMLVNQTRSWRERPHAGLTPGKIKNLVLAGDYVRSTTDFASMEAANETGRRAARVLLKRHGSSDQIEGVDYGPVVYDRLPVPRPVELLRELSGLLRKLGILLGHRLGDDGRLVSYDADRFADEVRAIGGLGTFYSHEEHVAIDGEVEVEDDLDAVDDAHSEAGADRAVPTDAGDEVDAEELLEEYLETLLRARATARGDADPYLDGYNDSWLPWSVRWSTREHVSIFEVCATIKHWVASLQQVADDLADRGLIERVKVEEIARGATEVANDLFRYFQLPAFPMHE